eukprot:scaffold4437_cov391-Prasinococcus_capsulatus_cf.AAC.2
MRLVCSEACSIAQLCCRRRNICASGKAQKGRSAPKRACSCSSVSSPRLPDTSSTAPTRRGHAGRPSSAQEDDVCRGAGAPRGIGRPAAGARGGRCAAPVACRQRVHGYLRALAPAARRARRAAPAAPAPVSPSARR